MNLNEYVLLKKEIEVKFEEKELIDGGKKNNSNTGGGY